MKKLTQITKCFFTSIFILVNINFVFSQQGVVFTEFSTNEGDNKIIFNPPMPSNSVVRVADLNNDGKDDFIAVSHTNNMVYYYFYQSKGNAEFELIDQIIDPSVFSIFSFVDINANGLLDLIVISSNKVKFFANKDSFRFEPIVSELLDTNRIRFRNIVDLRPTGKLMFFRGR